MRKLPSFLFLVVACRGEQLPVRHYTADEGLAGNRIQCILRDSHGFLWFCTTEGLSRFDGYQFTNFTEAQGLPRNNILDMLETREGVYWVATSSGPVRYTPAQPGSSTRFTLYPVGRLAALVLLEDHSGAIWCGTRSGLFRLAMGATAFEAVDIGMPLTSGGDDAIVSALLEDSRQTLWIGAGNALYCRSADGRARRYTVRDGLPSDFGFVQALLEDRQGRIWIGTRQGVCRTISHPPLDRLALEHVYTDRDGLPRPAWTEALFQSSDGQIWAATGGLNLYSGDDRQTPHFRAYTSAHGLVAGNVDVLAEDREGNLWVGTDGNGVMKITGRGFLRFTESDGISTMYIDSIFETRDGELCLMSEEPPKRLLNCFDGRRFVPVRPAFPASITDFGWGSSQIALQDRPGEWWIGTGNGLVRFPSTNSAAALDRRRPLAVYTVRDGLRSSAIFRVFEDSRGDIWVSTNGKDCLTRWDRATQTFHPVERVEDTPTAFAEDRAGDVWVGFFHGGLGRVRQGRWSSVTLDAAAAPLVSSLYTDSLGRLWVATDGLGVYRIDDPDQEARNRVHYTTGEGLASNRINSIAEDRQGHIWLATVRGVDCLDLSGGAAMPRVRHYSTDDGLAQGEGKFAFRDRSGALWFVMQHGLSRLTPTPETGQTPPPVLVTGVRVGGKSFALSDLGETNLRLPDLRPGQNQVEIEFAGLQFAAGETLRYQVGMKGEEPEWGPPTAIRSVNYQGLRPGRYRFRVRAINSAGVASATPATLDFVILPPFWQRWWSLLLAAMATATLVYAGHRYRLSQMLKLERIRMRIATDLHDDIGASLSQIAVLSEVARIDARQGRQVQEPLSRIAATSRELVDSMSEIVWAISPQRDRFSDLSRRMREFAEDVLVPRNVAFRLEVPGTGEDLKLGPDVRRQVFLIFKECIHNIARHSDCTEAWAELKIQKEELILRVGDNGMRLRTAENGSSKGGYGLANMRRRAKSLKGALDLTSEGGKGFGLVLRAPVDGR